MSELYIPVSQRELPTGSDFLEAVWFDGGLEIDFYEATPITLAEYNLQQREVFAVHEGSTVGRLSLLKMPTAKPMLGWHVGHIETSLRAVGIGTTLYLAGARALALLSEDEFIYSYGSRRPEAERCWERLCAVGLATAKAREHSIPSYSLPALRMSISEAASLIAKRRATPLYHTR